MKKIFIALVLSFFCAPARADVYIPPNAWELLKDRPRTTLPAISIPDPDAASFDVPSASEDVASDDVVRSADMETPER
ncbi:MAG: hypothetical protein LBT15_02970 [Synergistaceae bacterium]|jgi:hypothetical protein|nr:hypothetical protein [Synergistaceae bacterium]